MIAITRKFEFEAAHFLPDHPGKCKCLHGHRYELEVTVTGPLNLDTGMIVDFKMLKDLVNEQVVDLLDHSLLNESTLATFPCENPTAELMINWMARVLVDAFAKLRCQLVRLKLWETSNSWVEWIDESF